MAMLQHPADRAYLMRFLPTMGLYVVLVFAAPMAIRALHASGALRWALAILPALPIIAVFFILGRYLIELDDGYRRMLEVRKAMVATGFSMALATGWGFLEIYAQAPHIPLFFVPISWFAGLGLGAAVNRIVERGGREA